MYRLTLAVVAGKTSMLRLLGGLDRPDAGHIEYLEPDEPPRAADASRRDSARRRVA